MRIQWHRLFGLMLTDYLSDRGFRVELEKDLSLKRQLLDVTIVEKEDGEADLSGICDGFDNLSRHNLLSYKSRRQSLNARAMEELVGHCVNYRKALGRSGAAGDDVRLYAVSTRYPRDLFSLSPPRGVGTGVWEMKVLSLDVRVLVLSRLPMEQRNAVLAFFSFDREKVRFALENYRWRMKDGSTVVNQILDKYSLEGMDVPYTMEQFRKEYLKAHLGELDPEEVLSVFSPEERLKGLDLEERLKGLDAEERLKGLDAEEIEAYLKKLKEKKGH